MGYDKELNENLTLPEAISIDTLEGLPDILSEAVVLGKLSGLALKLEERRLAKLARKRKSLRERKRYTRKPGCIHPKKKAATKRRRLVRDWARRPYACVTHGWGIWRVAEADWNRLIQPLWLQYRPEDLKVKRYNGTGTHACPVTLYRFDVVHAQLGIVYSGSSQEIFDLSVPQPKEKPSSKELD